MVDRIHVVGAAIRDESRILAAQRGPSMSLAGQWEFPGGKVEAGEAAADALAREVLEELGVEVDVGELVARSTFTTRDRVIDLDVYWCVIRHGELEPVEHSELRWLLPDELDSVAWAAADVPIVALLQDELAD